ncbi:MAG: hypothetical protein AB1798_20760 [Spirochaetota bacterium]
MKYFGMIVMIVLVAVLCGCGTKAKVEDPRIKGEWKVLSANCPEILAEKDGARKVFIFRRPKGRIQIVESSAQTEKERMSMCRQVQTGWIIWAESEREYSFFPASAASASK